MKRGEIWWAELGPYRNQEQTGRQPVVIVQGDALSSVLQSVLVVPLTTNLEDARLAGTALIFSGVDALKKFVRTLTNDELAELELAIEEALGRVEPEQT